MSQEIRVQSKVKSYQRLKKWYSIPLCLALSIIRYISRLKWIYPGKEEVPFPTPWCSSYWNGSLRATLNNGSQLFYLQNILKIGNAQGVSEKLMSFHNLIINSYSNDLKFYVWMFFVFQFCFFSGIEKLFKY